jgi:hypothetical protein
MERGPGHGAAGASRPRWAAEPGRQAALGLPDGRGNVGSLDWQAFSAEATFGLSGFSPFRKRPARGAPLAGGLVGGGDGRVAGMAAPCDAIQVRNARNAAPNRPPPNPNPPAGRSDAHACRAFSIAALGEPKPPAGRAVGLAVGTLTPCWRRQVR